MLRAIGNSATNQIGKINSLANAINPSRDKTVTITTVFRTVGTPTGAGGAGHAGGFTSALSDHSMISTFPSYSSNQPVNITIPVNIDGKMLSKAVKKKTCLV
jgi:hypothetical protein